MNSSKFLIPNSRAKLSAILNIYQQRSYASPSDTPGSGIGKGGGGGSAKQPGTGLGKHGAVREDGYFYNKDREQMEKLKQKLKDHVQKEEKTRRPDQ